MSICSQLHPQENQNTPLLVHRSTLASCCMWGDCGHMCAQCTSSLPFRTYSLMCLPKCKHCPTCSNTPHYKLHWKFDNMPYEYIHPHANSHPCSRPPIHSGTNARLTKIERCTYDHSYSLTLKNMLATSGFPGILILYWRTFCLTKGLVLISD